MPGAAPVAPAPAVVAPLLHPAGPPGAPVVAAAAAGAPPPGVVGPVALFGVGVATRDQLEVMCNKLSLSLVRPEVTAALDAAPLMFTEAWTRLGRLKGNAQWRTKLTNLGQGAAVGAAMSQLEVGQYVFQHMCDDGEFSNVVLQPPHV